jgi:hypothetical protein
VFMLGRVSLAQDASWWPSKGAESVRLYDDLLVRTSQIADPDARGQILAWLGRSDIPGSPAERYSAVSEALRSGQGPSDVLKNRVDQLAEITSEFEAKVVNAEEAYGTLSAAAAAGSTPEASMGRLCFTGGVALLGLVIMPLLLD